MTPIRYKQWMYELWLAQKLGNRPRVWYTLPELQASGYSGDVWVRNARDVADPVQLYDVPVAMPRVCASSSRPSER
jgi:hypothetical protein